jgi:hypothetical protein
MKPEDKAWQKLVAAARLARDDRDTAAPYGFATRVAALAMAEQRQAPAGAWVERFSWRALMVAGLLAVGGVATNYASPMPANGDDEVLDETTVTAVFDLS